MKTRIIAIVAALAGLIAPLLVATPAAEAAASCKRPRYVTTDSWGMWNDDPYIVHNNIWNGGGYNITQKLTACSYKNWKVTVKADNSRGDGAVKTYPNVHRDYKNWGTGWEPTVRSFKKIKSSWTAKTPGRGIYNAAYDVWLNEFDREVMIWTDNKGQTPAGRRVARSVKLSGQRWDVWASNDNKYLAFVPKKRLKKGTLNLKSILDYGRAKGRIPMNATLAQIGFGFEVVSTRGKYETFSVSRFSISTRR